MKKKKEKEGKQKIASVGKNSNNSGNGWIHPRVHTREPEKTWGEGAHVNAAAAVDYEWSSLDLSFSLIVSYALRRYPLSTELYNNLMPDIISYLLSGRLPALPYSFLYESWKAAAEQMER